MSTAQGKPSKEVLSRVRELREALAYQLWREVGERHQDETTFPHPRVRHFEVGLVKRQVTHQQHIDIEGARPPMYFPSPPCRRFSPLARLEQLAHSEIWQSHESLSLSG